MRSALREAITQLPENGPGLIVIRTEGVLDEGQSRFVVEGFLAGGNGETSHVTAVIFLLV